MKLEDAKIGLRVSLCRANWLKIGGIRESFDDHFTFYPFGRIIDIKSWGIQVRSLFLENMEQHFRPEVLVLDE